MTLIGTIVASLSTAFASILVAWITAHATKRKQNFEIEQLLREQLRQTDDRVGVLADELQEERIKRKNLTAELTRLAIQDDTKVAYIRAIGHWLNELCEVLEPRWAEEHPKPRLPESIRNVIDETAQHNNLEV